MRKCTLEFVCYLPRKIPNFGTSLRKGKKVISQFPILW